MSEKQQLPCAKKNRKYPVYLDHLPPCNKFCPLGNDIQHWLGLVQQGDLRAAWECIMRNNALPAIHGRVCYHYCETACNRSNYDSSVNIHVIERFLGDMAISEGWQVQAGTSTGKKILVVGAGPAGLSAAYHLRLLGHAVTIYEKLPVAGGMMFAGIPAYRLPRKVLAAEVQHILSMGVDIEYNHNVVDVLHERMVGNFDAVFLAVGAHVGKKLNVTGRGNCLFMDAATYLCKVALNHPVDLGKRLIVYGGGNTAIDVARTAIRLGLEDVHVVYHRSLRRMAAFDVEINDAIAEGVKLHCLRTITRVDDDNVFFVNNVVDEDGNITATTETTVLAADAVIFALNQTPDIEFIKDIHGITVNGDNTVCVDDKFMTGCDGVFAGGDVVPFERSITVATGHGKHAARHIDAYLKGELYTRSLVNAEVGYDKLRISLSKTARIEHDEIAVAERVKSFAEVVIDIEDSRLIKQEADRCFSCGNCFECDVCYDGCPVKAIKKLGVGKRYSVDSNVCIGCGKCYRRCPCGAIEMVVSS